MISREHKQEVIVAKIATRQRIDLRHFGVHSRNIGQIARPMLSGFGRINEMGGQRDF